MSDQGNAFRDKLATVRLLVIDLDRVLTENTLRSGASAAHVEESDARDGLGLRVLMDRGIHVAVITARRDSALARRVSELEIPHFYQGRADKSAALDEILRVLEVAESEVAYVGDGFLDLRVLRRVGVSITTGDGHPQVRREVDWVTDAKGGRGAVREVTHALLNARKDLRGATTRYLAGLSPLRRSKQQSFRVVIAAPNGALPTSENRQRTLDDRPMIARVWDRGIDSGAREVIVAADDERTIQAVRHLGGKSLLMETAHTSDTARLAEVAWRERWEDDEIVVGLQGDGPCMPAALIRQIASALAARPNVGIATIATPITKATELFDASVVKVVLNAAGLANYFSRAPIPWLQGAFTATGGAPAPLPPGIPFLRHVALYAYRVGTLRRISASPPSATETA